MAKILFIIPPERFRDEELFVTEDFLKEKGHKTFIASTVKGRIDGSRGGNARSELTLDEIKTKDYDTVIFVGGGGSKLLFDNEIAQRIAKEMQAEGKLVSAICLAPVILANAGILKGVRATVAGTEAELLKQKGAKYMGPGVFVDKRIVTANGPKSSLLFAKEIDKLLANK